MSLKSRVIAALGTVYDPELDEPITTLGFVGSCVVTEEGDVAVRLRLPTPQCAPNFAFLMAADARAAVRRLPDVAAVDVVLEDHYTGAEINAAIIRGEASARRSPARRGGARRAARAVPAQGAARPPGAAARPLGAAQTLGRASRPRTRRTACVAALRRALGDRRADDAPAFVAGRRRAGRRAADLRLRRMASLTA